MDFRSWLRLIGNWRQHTTGRARCFRRTRSLEFIAFDPPPSDGVETYGPRPSSERARLKNGVPGLRGTTRRPKEGVLNNDAARRRGGVAACGARAAVRKAEDCRSGAAIRALKTSTQIHEPHLDRACNRPAVG